MLQKEDRFSLYYSVGVDEIDPSCLFGFFFQFLKKAANKIANVASGAKDAATADAEASSSTANKAKDKVRAIAVQ